MLSGKQAIVIGGGIAGLLVARVLTEHFERVLLIERDHYPAEPVFRAGVPQGRHVHTLLLRGQQTVEQLFPGITEKLIARGAIKSDFLQDYVIYTATGCLPRPASPLKGYTCTRLLLEWQIRQELLKNAQVQVIEGHEVTGLVASSDMRSVQGVRVRERNMSAPAESVQEEMLAELVVDASGRESRAPKWLEEMGYAAPEETVINAFLGYATCTFQPPANVAYDWKGLGMTQDAPRNLRGGVLWPIEGGRWMVVLAGSGGTEYPPTDEEGFLEFARGMLDTALYDVLKDATPVTPIYGYRRTENRFRHFERLQRHPERFVTIGDAFCAFNPVYGQGMTVASLNALALHSCLQQQAGLTGLPQRFYKRQAAEDRLPWQLASSQDDRVLQGLGKGRKLSQLNKLMNSYLRGLGEILPKSQLACQAFGEVQHMVKPPSALFQPAIIWKVLTRKRT